MTFFIGTTKLGLPSKCVVMSSDDIEVECDEILDALFKNGYKRFRLKIIEEQPQSHEDHILPYNTQDAILEGGERQIVIFKLTGAAIHSSNVIIYFNRKTFTTYQAFCCNPKLEGP